MPNFRQKVEDLLSEYGWPEYVDISSYTYDKSMDLVTRLDKLLQDELKNENLRTTSEPTSRVEN
jgi:hypothetical protein